jgi:hypothetical protein
MIQGSTIAGLAKAAIAANPNFRGVTPELDAIVSAIASATASAVNAELAIMRVQFNVHTHVTPVGPTAPPLPPMTV